MTDQGAKVNTRALALEFLLETAEKGGYSHVVMRGMLEKYQYLDKKERAFLTRLCEGTLERMLELDAMINQFSKVPVKKMKPVIRNLLRLSVYQLKYMDQIPDSAVCNEAVKLAQKKGFSGLKGFVNGVLRNIARELPNVKFGELSIQYSTPRWIVDQWISEYGKEKAVQMLADQYLEKPITIRVDLSKISREALAERLREEGVQAEPLEDMDCALAIKGYDYLRALPSFREGLFQVQDVSSMKAALAADPKEGDTCIDVCAAPGGKSLHLAELLHGTGKVEARDLTDYKVGLIQDNIDRTGAKNIRAVQMDATVLDEESIGKADVVLADLPCSGLGVLNKKTDLKYRMMPEQQAALVGLQRQILSAVWQYVKPGGTLVYSTCTVHKEENEGNVEWFLKNYPFILKEQIQMLPGVDPWDGFFIAKLERKRND